MKIKEYLDIDFQKWGGAIVPVLWLLAFYQISGSFLFTHKTLLWKSMHHNATIKTSVRHSGTGNLLAHWFEEKDVIFYVHIVYKYSDPFGRF